ncbi:unnamed protein product [Phytophthora lilii]|uniref:Unnamed protein product n=1 Tax=Phytophthora lilii TaxID=2077276 RepID=A0A9W7CKX7_9STRA|nr:unnamed protein product [Phytophthora lilii]
MTKITQDDFAYINNPEVFEAETKKAFDEANEYLYGESYNPFCWNADNHSAFHVFSNYSYGYVNHVDIVADAIKWVQLYARRFFTFDHDISPSLVLVWLKVCKNPYIIKMIGDVCTDYDRYMELFDRDTYEGDMREDLGDFLEINNYFDTPSEMRYIYDKAV